MTKQWILHDWNDKECVDILKKCKEAITRKGKEGKVIIIDMVVEDEKRDDESVETQLFFDMQMMVLVTGKERSKKEWTKLISSAGYNNYKITPVFGLRSLIEIYPYNNSNRLNSLDHSCVVGTVLSIKEKKKI
ncbi:hypothetical protein JHK82_040604 [Glycine max]|nr:hypothetical protein JHK86_040799 [Glycine max]KAG5111381.1 hypothetical protein JHK82_040604 [Glycine max]KAG5122669.1 hypothetical protein JHK84_041009 [Glycine max]